IAVLAAEGEDAAAAAKSGDGAAAPAKAEAKQDKAPISPPVGEMSTKSTEGGAVPPAARSEAPPSGLPAISPTRGEISQSDGRIFASPLARRIAREAG
ncbi:MAG: pyruvate dehydrogenase complex dihydrolipoamide acetyltransferase, partial [Mesorhizobium sp.]